MSLNNYVTKVINAGKTYIKQKYNILIEKGDIVLLVGSNGSGKTTLIKMILGLIKPDFGNIYKSISRLSFLPEKISLPGEIDVYTYLMQIAKIKRSYINHEYINNFEIPLYTKIKNLSKGNMQKVAILSTLLGNSDFIIFDEPLTGLDVKSSNQFLQTVMKLSDEKKTILISTHNPKLFYEIENKRITL